MIERFRKKFILFATLSIFVLLVAILSTINIVNFTILANNADEVTALLAEKGGQFTAPDQGGPGGFPGEWPGERPGGPMDPISAETEASTRYFTVRIDAADNAELVKMALTEDTVRPEEALSWGASLVGKEKGWTRTTFRFRTYLRENYIYVSVIDYARELSPSYRVLWGSLIGGGAGLLVAFLALLPVSRLLIKPLSTAHKKQQLFIADASHELKTPITIISANNEIIEAEHGESEQTRAITKQVQRLTHMIKNLNALARLEAEPKPISGSFDLARLCRETVDTFEPAFAGKNLQFSAEIPDELPMKGDESSFHKLLSVLLDNALKYARSFAEFHLYRNDDRVCIKVINDAEGLEEGSLDRVFERFYRSDAARASGVEGSGIGLSIAKQIVDQHAGRIKAKCEGGKFIIKATF